jgi:DNA polymerase-4
MVDRIILHINIVNFFISVARVLEPKWIGYPVAVRTIDSRRVLADVSSEAQAAGVKRGMITDTAKRLCPDLVVLDPVPSAYDRAEHTLIKQATNLSPLAETAGPGHLFIDLTGTGRLFGSSVDIAESLRKEIKSQCSMDCTMGLASNRLVSKVATRVVKPTGFCNIVHGGEESFLEPLPVQFLPGLELHLLEQLTQFNIRIVKEINAIPESSLVSVLGPVAHDIVRHAHGIDDTPVRELTKPALTVTEKYTLGEQTNDQYVIAGALFHLVSRAGSRIRKLGLATSKISIKVTYADGNNVKNVTKLSIPLRGDLSLFEAFSSLLKKTIVRRVRLTELAIRCEQLTFPYGQTDLFVNTEQEEHLMSAIDSIRNNFGEEAIRFWGRGRH